jgi:hypothetical protein
MRGGKRRPTLGEYSTIELDLDSFDTEFISFHYNMRIKGLHHLIAYVKCKGDSSHIHLGESRTIFGIPHFNKNEPKTGRACLRLHPSIKNFHGVSEDDCQQFQVIIQAAGLYSKVCLKDFRFFSESNRNALFCRKSVLRCFKLHFHKCVVDCIATISNS